MRPALRIRVKLMLLVLLASLPALGVVLYSGLTAEREAFSSARHDAAHIARDLARHEEQLMASTRQFLASLTRIPAVRELDARVCAPLFQELLEANPVYSDIVLSDPSGRVLAAAHSWPTGRSTGDAPHFKAAIASRDFVVGAYRKSGSTGLDVLVCAYPVRRADGRVLGVLSTGLRLDRFVSILSHIELPDDSTIFMADREGTRLVHRHFPDLRPSMYTIGRQVSLKLRGILDTAPTGSPFLAVGLDGRQRLYVLQRSRLRAEDAPYLHVGVSIPTETIRREARHGLLGSLAILGAAILMAVAAAWVMGRRTFTDRIERLAAVAGRFAAGDFSARASLPASGPGSRDELGRLGAAVDNIGEELARREAEREATLERLALTQFAVDNAGDEIYWADEAGRIVYANRRAARSLGYTRKDLMRLSVFDLDAHMDKAAWGDRLEQLRTAGPIVVETLHRNRAGALVPKEMTISRLDTAGGIMVYASARDITERKRHTAVLRSLVYETAAVSGQAFFDALAGQMVALLGVQAAIVVEYLDQPPTRARALAQATGPGLPELPPREFDLAGTPAPDIPEHGHLHMESGARLRYPKSFSLNRIGAEGYLAVVMLDAAGCKIGHFTILTTRSMPADPQLADTLKLFAQRASAELQRLRDERSIRASLTEKEVLLKEIHHRVKNNMQIVSSLLSLQAREVTDPAVLELLAQSRARILSMALVHEDLYQTGNLAQVDFKRYLGRLSERVRSGSAGGDTVRLELELEELALPVDQAIPMGLLANELLTNAFKHAFADGRPGLLRVLLSQEGGMVRMEVRDDGPGLPPDFDPQNGKTLGMQLVWGLAEQLRGGMTIGEGPGASFILTFPAP
jgi:PAS domain S-box-containing protein